VKVIDSEENAADLALGKGVVGMPFFGPVTELDPVSPGFLQSSEQITRDSLSQNQISLAIKKLDLFVRQLSRFQGCRRHCSARIFQGH